MTRVKLMLIVLVVGSTVFLSSCQTTATQERFMAAQDDVSQCRSTILMARQNAPAAPQFKSETNMLLYLVVQELAKSKSGNDLDYCDDAYIAMIRTDGIKMNSLINRGFGLAGLGMGVWGAAIITDGIVDLAGSRASSFSSGDITVNNSAGDAAQAAGGASTMNTVLGGGSIQTLTGGSAITTAEKQIVNPSASDSGVIDLNDSGDGANNDASLF